MTTLVGYCLKHNNHELLSKIALESNGLTSIVVEETLKQSQTKKHLNILLKLISSIRETKLFVKAKKAFLYNNHKNNSSQKKSLYSRAINKVFNVCQKIWGETLNFLYYARFNNSASSEKNLYSKVINKLMIIWVSDPKSKIRHTIPYNLGIIIMDNLIDNNNIEGIKKYFETIKKNNLLLSLAIHSMVKKGEITLAIQTLKEIGNKRKLYYKIINDGLFKSDLYHFFQLLLSS